MKKRVFLSLFLLLIFIAGLVLPAHANDRFPRQQEAEPLALEQSYEQQITVHGTLPTLKMPSQEEIRAKWKAVTSASTVFLTSPSVSAPYATGALTEDFLESGITYLNYVRFVAGLPEVTLDDSMNKNAQYGAVLLAAIDELTHYPSRPGDMDMEFYEQGYSATSSSNLSARWGYGAPTKMLQSSIIGCMNDNNSLGNLETVGHRRWLLNPTLGKVGFGYAESATEWSYIVTKVFDRSGTGCDFDFIGWPVAGNHPTNLFDAQNPWSLTLNTSVYQTVSLNSVTVTLTRESDGTQWSFNGSTGNPNIDNDGNIAPYLTVETSWYGLPNCIIFHPGTGNIGALQGTFQVDVGGIYLRDGTQAHLSYDVRFFDVNQLCTEHAYTASVTEPTCTAEGYTTFTCSLCGYSYVDYHVGVVDHCYEDGYCKWCGKENVLADGICGENATWVLTPDGTLTISGTGPMYDYEYREMPWTSLLEDIRCLVIADGVTRIGSNAFREAINLTDVSLSDTITEIGRWSFMRAENLTAVTLPQYLTSLEQEAFMNCVALEEIELPGTLSFIDAGVFSQCYSLKRAVIHSDPNAPSLVMGNSVFSSCTALESIEVDEDHFCLKSIDGVLYHFSVDGLSLQQYPAGKKDTVFRIPDGTYDIFQLALENVKVLEELIIPDGVQQIGKMAFIRCNNLKRIQFLGDAPEFSEDIFWGLTASVYYPADNATWTENKLKNYGGTITWVPYTPASTRFVTISASLGGNIAMNFYTELSADLVADPDAYIQFTFAGKTLHVPLSEGKESVKNGVTVYQLSCPITSKNMTDEITAQVYNANGPVGTAKTMSVATYCNWVIENYKDEKTVNLMKAMLNYGASAQMLFNYRTDDLANGTLPPEDKVFGAVDASAYKHSVVGTEEGIIAKSMTLLLDSETTIRVYFELTGDKTIDEFTFTVDGVEVTPVYKNGRYYIEKRNISAHRLDDMYIFTCGDITITYGGLSYVNQIMTYYQSGTTFDMGSALYAYSMAAEAYIR